MEEKKTDERAIPFIMVAQDGTFEITEPAMEWLRGLGDTKVSVTTVVGPWRSGKSFLASMLCNRQEEITLRIDMFKTGSSVQPQTRGFWIASKVMRKNEEYVELVMDTEGLFSTDRGGISDINIALLAVLLSSQFVYNTMGIIKDSVIRQLGLVSQITNHFYISEDQKEQDRSSIAPNFLWVLRDTSLVLKTGQTPTQYLDEKLNFESTDPSQRELYQGILDFFKSRACFTLVRPITDDSKLKYLSSMRNTDLRPEFNKGMDAITRWFDINSRPKMLRGRPLTASTFLGLAQQYIRSINEHATPIVMNSLDNVLSMEVVSIKEETLEYAKDLIHKRLASNKANLPNQSEVDEILRKVVIDAQTFYFSKIFEILDYETSRQATESIRVQLLALMQSARNQQFEKSMKSGYQFLDHQHISNFVDSKLKVEEDRDKQIRDLIAFINKKYEKYKINPGGMAYAQSLVISFKEAALPAFIRLAEELKAQLEEEFTSFNQSYAVNQVEINSRVEKNKQLSEQSQKLNQEIERQTSGLGELNNQEKSIKRQQETQKKDYESNLNSLTEIYLKKSKELHDKKDKEQKELIELFERKNLLESQLQHIKSKKETEERRQGSEKVKLEEEIKFRGDQIEGGKKKQEQMEIDKMFEGMKGEFKNFKDFLKHLEKVKILKHDIRMLQRSLHEQEVQVKTNSLNEKIESSQLKLTQRAQQSRKVEELEKQAAAMREEVNRLKNLKLNRDIEIKLLNTKLEMKQSESKIQADQVKTILSLKSTTTRTTNYKKEELVALNKDIENREIEKVKFSVKSAEQQMTLDDLISFISSMISYYQRKTAENRRDMRFLFNKLDPDVRNKLDFAQF